MRKLICVLFSLCLFTSLVFGNSLVYKEGCLVEKKSNLVCLIPSAIFGRVSYYVWVKASEEKKAIDEVGMIILSTLTGVASILLFHKALSIKKVYWLPKLDEDGTIWFKKEVIKW